MKVIHYFNPGHENAVLNRTPAYTAPASMTTLMSELSSLPMWYANSDELVFCDDKEAVAYRSHLVNIGLDIPYLLTKIELLKYNKVNISMWGITPQAIRFFEAINKEYNIELNIPNWNEKYIYLNSREVSSDVLAELKEESSLFDFIDLPILCKSLDEIAEIVKNKKKYFVAKAPYSSSGRGLLWLPNGEITRVEQQILGGILKKQGFVSVEKVYNKRLDFAMEFMSDGEGQVDFVGYSFFETNKKGAYQSNILLPQCKIEEKLAESVDSCELKEIKLLVSNILSKYYGSSYKGCLGVDMMIVFEGDRYKIHPCVEINMRYNMGFLSIQLFDKFVCPESTGKYILDFSNSGGTYLSHLEMQAKYPLKLKAGKVVSGYLSLCPVLKETKYRAYILIED